MVVLDNECSLFLFSNVAHNGLLSLLYQVCRAFLSNTKVAYIFPPTTIFQTLTREADSPKMVSLSSTNSVYIVNTLFYAAGQYLK